MFLNKHFSSRYLRRCLQIFKKNSVSMLIFFAFDDDFGTYINNITYIVGRTEALERKINFH